MTGLGAVQTAVIGVVFAPTLAFAQAQTQLDVMNQAFARCANAATQPADWPEVFADWVNTPRTDQDLTNAYIAASLMLIYGADEDFLGEPTALDVASFLSEFDANFSWDATYFVENPDHFSETFYTHSTGWHLAIIADPEDAAFNSCVFWHPTPDQAVIETLQAPYLAFDPIDVLFGTYSYSEWRTGDVDQFGSLDVEVLIIDEIGTLPEAVLAEHPVRFVPHAYISLFHAAYSRES